MPSRASGSRPTELDDPKWLRRRLETASQTTIALELGVSRKAIRSACARLGIATAGGPGRRRGITPVRSHEDTTETLVLDRFRTEARANGPAPSEDLLVQRLHAAHNARQASDHDGYDTELIGIACAAMLIHEHRQTLRKAA